jgi:hypothetical protein
MAFVFGTGMAGKDGHHFQAVLTLVWRRSFSRPRDRADSPYVGLTTGGGKTGEVPQEAFRHAKREAGCSAHGQIRVHSIVQHGDTSGHGRAIWRSLLTSTFA